MKPLSHAMYALLIVGIIFRYKSSLIKSINYKKLNTYVVGLSGVIFNIIVLTKWLAKWNFEIAVQLQLFEIFKHA